jgi:hypothetical protein
MKMSFPSVEYATAAWIECSAVVSESLCCALRHFLRGGRRSRTEIIAETERIRLLYYRLMRGEYSQTELFEFFVCLGLVPQESRAYSQAQKLQAELIEML